MRLQLCVCMVDCVVYSGFQIVTSLIFVLELKTIVIQRFRQTEYSIAYNIHEFHYT